jgi:hypothetical protein
MLISGIVGSQIEIERIFSLVRILAFIGTKIKFTKNSILGFLHICIPKPKPLK